MSLLEFKSSLSHCQTKFSFSLAKLTAQHRNHSNYVIIFQVDVEMFVIFLDSTEKKFLKKLTVKGNKLLILSF